MKHHKFYFIALLTFSMAILLSCGKNGSTIINGTVIDARTGKPLDKTSITFSSHLDASKSNPNGSYVYAYTSTDSTGKFSSNDIKILSDGPLTVWEVNKTGYLPKGVGGHVVDINQGEINDVTIPIIPKDGTLTLNFADTSGSHNTLYVRVYSQLQFQEAGISVGKIWSKTLDVPNWDQIPFSFPLASLESVKVYWSFSPVMYDYLKDYPFLDSVYITPNNTTHYTINF